MKLLLYPDYFSAVIEELRLLPGLGVKSAERIALYLLHQPQQRVLQLSNVLIELKNNVAYCTRCFNLADSSMCSICNQVNRNSEQICIIENPKDLQAIEKSYGYNGLYHVLLGKISPLDGISPDDLKIKELLQRLKNEATKEVIIATGSDMEGEATALYLTNVLKPFSIRITRIAQGLPIGSAIEHADEVTIARALEGRRVL